MARNEGESVVRRLLLLLGMKVYALPPGTLKKVRRTKTGIFAGSLYETEILILTIEVRWNCVNRPVLVPGIF